MDDEEDLYFAAPSGEWPKLSETSTEVDKDGINEWMLVYVGQNLTRTHPNGFTEEEFSEALLSAQLEFSMNRMEKLGLVDLGWDDEAEDVTLRITDKGREVADVFRDLLSPKDFTIDLEEDDDEADVEEDKT